MIFLLGYFQRYSPHNCHDLLRATQFTEFLAQLLDEERTRTGPIGHKSFKGREQFDRVIGRKGGCLFHGNSISFQVATTGLHYEDFRHPLPGLVGLNLLDKVLLQVVIGIFGGHGFVCPSMAHYYVHDKVEPFVVFTRLFAGKLQNLSPGLVMSLLDCHIEVAESLLQACYVLPRSFTAGLVVLVKFVVVQDVNDPL